MKKMTLATAGLVSLIGLGLAGTAQAADSSNTQGHVSFDVNWSIEPPIKTDSIENPNGSSAAGDNDLAVIYAMDFDFGSHSYDGQELTDLPVAVGSYAPTATPDAPIKDALGISIGNSGNTTKWYLYANASEFKGNGKTVNGLRMTLHDITARQVVGTQTPTIPSAASLELDPSDKLVASYENNSAEPEMTITNFAFGTYTSGDTYDGVTLDVPAGKAIENGVTYISDITWTLAVDPIQP